MHWRNWQRSVNYMHSLSPELHAFRSAFLMVFSWTITAAKKNRTDRTIVKITQYIAILIFLLISAGDSIVFRIGFYFSFKFKIKNCVNLLFYNFANYVI